jgi:hypothetical protein
VDVVDAILWITRNGAHWSNLDAVFPSWKSVGAIQNVASNSFFHSVSDGSPFFSYFLISHPVFCLKCLAGLRFKPTIIGKIHRAVNLDAERLLALALLPG